MCSIDRLTLGLLFTLTHSDRHGRTHTLVHKLHNPSGSQYIWRSTTENQVGKKTKTNDRLRPEKGISNLLVVEKKSVRCGHSNEKHRSAHALFYNLEQKIVLAIVKKISANTQNSNTSFLQRQSWLLNDTHRIQNILQRLHHFTANAYKRQTGIVYFSCVYE